MVRSARNTLIAAGAFIAFFLLPTSAGATSFRHGVIGVELPKWVGSGAAWSPDGRWIAIPAKTGPTLRNVETGAVRRLHAPAFQGFPLRPGRLDWAPDGKAIRYATSAPREGSPNSWLTEVPLDGSEAHQQSLGVKAFDTAWAPSGWPFAFTTGTYAYDFDKGPIGPKPALLVVDRFGEEPRRVAQITHDIGEAEISWVQFSPDGERILFCRYQGRKASVRTVRPDGSDPQRLWGGLTYCNQPSWSPHGGQVVLVAVRAGSLVPHPYVLPTGGGKPHRLVNQQALDGPIWSPDGRWLTFSDYDGEIRRVHPDGRGEQVIATMPGKEVRDLLWSPDGRHLAYTERDFPPFD